MSNKLHRSLLAAAVSGVVCANAWALDPQGIKLSDGVIFTPTLKVAESYDDNFRAVENDEESSWITTIAPTFTLGAEGRKSAYQVSYTAVSDTFHSSHKDNNTDHHLTGDVGVEFDARNRLKLNAGYHDVEDTASLDQQVENDMYNTKNVGGVYTYGAETARAQIDFGANYEELRYTNSDHLNADKERDSTALRSTFYYRVAPKTKALLEARYTDYNYVSNDLRNSENTGLLAGVTWEATAKTTGTAKFGREKKDFDDSSVGEKSGGMWEVGATWEPRTYSRFGLNTRRGFDEGEDNASTIESQTTTLSWEHDWAERLTSNVSYTRSDRDYQDIEREDKIDTFGVGLTYAMRRWLDVGIGYKYSENDSDAVNESYERNIYALTFNASL
ncbi:outer membrane beta-barrel protein [Pseudomonas sp. GCM10022188]|uniref:outer membrane beta-barrel protein n=1 Tax=Pseudomonas TaxID=286 RepID=UPI001E31E9B9|nr:outer membrane beta-barrel protein [Pseudomonas oryzagri]MCC6076909.1 outer membrane beta-barrel protein [Pseudomonas oryzagri]